MNDIKLPLRDPQLLRNFCLIGGKWCESETRRTIEVLNPATGQTIGTVPAMSPQETHEAIAVAQQAFVKWSKIPAKERATLLRRWFDAIMANQDDLAIIMTSEQGKPLTEARGEVTYGASFIEWFSEEARRAYGDTIPSPQSDKRIIVLKQPVGVCAAITPWNFPIAMLTRKVGPALAAGCSIVVKPASQTPYSALAIAWLAEKVGIPAGVINVVTGKAQDIGLALCQNTTVRKISFTGSTEVGRTLMRESAGTVKRVSLELGGNAPFIVLDDADIDSAVEGAIVSKFRNAGQTCVCANRFFVQRQLYESFIERLSARVAEFKIGNGMEAGIEIGPLIDEAGVKKVEDHIRTAVSEGASLVVGGKRLYGSFITPAVLRDAKSQMKVCREETFGPIAPVVAFDNDDELIAQANDTEYGLAAYLYGRSLSRLWHIAERLEYGMVGINTGLVSTCEAPFGGMKQSGLGREGSKYGIDEYLELKYLSLAIG